MFTFLHSYLPSSIIFNWGSLTLHWYGLWVGMAIVAAYFVLQKSLKRQTWPITKLDSLFFWLLLGAISGARLVDVFTFEWWYFKDHWWDILLIWQGGLSWHGALFGMAIAVGWWSVRQKENWLSLADYLTPALALGQAVGRWGNYFNQELFGLPTNLPWGIPIASPLRPSAFAAYSYFHPVFLYEFLGLLILFYILWRLGRFYRPGRQLVVYLIGSGLLRWVLEFIRLDEQSLWWGVRVGFWLAGLMMVLGLVLWLILKFSKVNVKKGA